MAALRLIGLKPLHNHTASRRRSIPGKVSGFHGLSAVREPVAISKSECRLRSLAALSDEKMVCTSESWYSGIACHHGVMQPAHVAEE